MPAKAPARQRSEAEARVINQAFDALRNPNTPLDQRLVARSKLVGRSSLTRDEVESWRAYDPILAMQVGEAGKVVAGVRYFAVGRVIAESMA